MIGILATLLLGATLGALVLALVLRSGGLARVRGRLGDLRELAHALRDAAKSLARGGPQLNSFAEPLVERSEGLKKTAVLLERLATSPTLLSEVPDAPDGNWFRRGFLDYQEAFQSDRPFLMEIERGMEEVLGTTYTNQDFRSLAVLWAAATGFQPDVVIEIGRSVGGTTLALSRARRHCPQLRAIVSVDIDNTSWEKTTAHFGDRIDLQNLEVITHDGRYLPWRKIIGQAQRPLIVLDAHDTPRVQLMDQLIAELFEPALVKPFLALVHDMPYESDPRSVENVARPEAWDSVGFCNQLWSGEYYWGFAEAVPLIDWLNSRRVRLRRPHIDMLQELPSPVHDALPDGWQKEGEPYTTWVSFSHLDLPSQGPAASPTRRDA